MFKLYFSGVKRFSVVIVVCVCVCVCLSVYRCEGVFFYGEKSNVAKFQGNQMRTRGQKILSFVFEFCVNQEN